MVVVFQAQDAASIQQHLRGFFHFAQVRRECNFAPIEELNNLETLFYRRPGTSTFPTCGPQGMLREPVVRLRAQLERLDSSPESRRWLRVASRNLKLPKKHLRPMSFSLSKQPGYGCSV